MKEQLFCPYLVSSPYSTSVSKVLMSIFRRSSIRNKKRYNMVLAQYSPWSLGFQQSITSPISLLFSIVNGFTHPGQLWAMFAEAQHVMVLAPLMEGQEKVLCNPPGRKLFPLMTWQVLDSIEKREAFLLPPNGCSPWEMCPLTFSSHQLVPSITPSANLL